MAYYTDRNWALWEVQPTFDAIDIVLISYYES